MKNQFFLFCLLSIFAMPVFAENWRPVEMKVVSSTNGSPFSKEAGLKTVNLKLETSDETFVRMDRYPTNTQITANPDGSYNIIVKAESNNEAQRRLSLILESQGPDSLTIQTELKDGIFNVIIDGVNQGAIRVQGQDVRIYQWMAGA